MMAPFRMFIVISAVYFYAFVPVSCFAQEDILLSDDLQATTTEADVPVQLPMPYETETLLGDGVFGDFVVGPGKVELSINPGESKTVEITVSNRTGKTRIFEIVSEDAKGSTDPSQAMVLLGDDRGPYSMKDYVSVQAPRFELPHNVRARIPVTISVPADAEPGGLYGSVLVSTVSSEAREGGIEGTAPQSAVVARIGALFFITIPGASLKEGNLKDFTTVPSRSLYQNGPIPFGILFENKGSVHLAPYGEIRIRNFFDEEVGFIEIDPWFVLPYALRLREVSWEREFLFGRYTATAYINRSYDDVIDEKVYTFWVLPWKPLVGGFVAIFGIIFMIRTFFKKFEFKRKT
jgi:hypothetical protein